MRYGQDLKSSFSCHMRNVFNHRLGNLLPIPSLKIHLADREKSETLQFDVNWVQRRAYRAYRAYRDYITNQMAPFEAEGPCDKIEKH